MTQVNDKAYERETIITTDDDSTFRLNEEEATAEIWSASPAFQRRMAKLGVEAHKTDRRGKTQSCWYKIPKAWIRIRKPTQYDLTPAQRAERAARAKNNFRHPVSGVAASPGVQ